MYDSNVQLDHILIIKGCLQSVFDVYLNYISIEKHYDVSPSQDYCMCELYHIEKCLDNVEYCELVSTDIVMLFIYF